MPSESLDFHEALGYQIIQDFWSVEAKAFHRRKETVSKVQETWCEKEHRLHRSETHQLAGAICPPGGSAEARAGPFSSQTYFSLSKPLQDATDIKSPCLLRLLLAGTVPGSFLVSEDLDSLEENPLGVL